MISLRRPRNISHTTLHGADTHTHTHIQNVCFVRLRPSVHPPECWTTCGCLQDVCILFRRAGGFLISRVRDAKVLTYCDRRTAHGRGSTAVRHKPSMQPRGAYTKGLGLAHISSPRWPKDTKSLGFSTLIFTTRLEELSSSSLYSMRTNRGELSPHHWISVFQYMWSLKYPYFIPV